MLLSSLTLFGAMLAALQTLIFSTAPSASALTASLTINTPPVESNGVPSKHLVNRAPDGLFYVDGTINGVPIKFAVDTGASVVVLNEIDAERVGLQSQQALTHQIRTAAGYSAMKWSKADELVIAGKKLKEIDIAIMNGGPKVSLLGLNALSRFEMMTIKKDQLIIE
ncbi:MAG: TIGR02281 family clan AA aspartic protease [Parasphingorhabdus sp.]